MAVTREQFAAWRKDRCYQEFFADIASQIEEASATVINREAVETDKDQLLKGFIKGLVAAAEWQPEFIEEGIDEEA